MIKKASVIIATITCFLMISPLANALNSSSLPDKDSREAYLFEQMILMLENSLNTDADNNGCSNLSISDIKTVCDFAENSYTLVECAPIGYFLYHNESARFAEYASDAISPYLNMDNDLYYIGPGNYYILKNGVFQHAMLDTKLDNIEVDSLIKTSQELNDYFLNNKNTTILDYLSGKIYSLPPVTSDMNNANYEENSSKISLYSSNVNGYKMVENYKFFKNLKKCGVNSEGTCGYMAAAILLAYQKSTYEGNYFLSSYLTTSSLSDQLHQSLYTTGKNLGYSNSTTSREIRFTVNEYLQKRGISVDYIDEYIPFANNSYITQLIDNDRPVIWFGLVSENTFDNRKDMNHAVVVYGYQVNWLIMHSYVAHFGWENATAVNFSGILGSMYSFYA